MEQKADTTSTILRTTPSEARLKARQLTEADLIGDSDFGISERRSTPL
jgi:hypothetical protein